MSTFAPGFKFFYQRKISLGNTERSHSATRAGYTTALRTHTGYLRGAFDSAELLLESGEFGKPG